MEQLQELANRLAIPGLPEWSGLVAVLVLVLVALAYLLMPFSVFGVKGRLEEIEVRLDEIQADLRALAARLPDGSRRTGMPSEHYLDLPRAQRTERDLRPTPPAPPPPARPEPRLDWPDQTRQ